MRDYDFCSFGGDHVLYLRGPSGTLHFDSPSAPAPLDYYKTTADTLKAQTDLAPKVYAVNAEYGPKYSALQLSTLESMLNGMPGQQGFLSAYENNILPALTRAQNTARAGQAAGTLDTLNTLGPAATAAFKSANPGGSALQDLLTKTATDQLQLGTQLDPNSLSQIHRSVSGNWANRGLGTSNPAMLDEALQMHAGGQGLLQNRMSNASSVSGQDYSQSLAPLEALLGQPISSVGSEPGITGRAGSLIAGVPGINPESDLSSSIASYNANATNDYNKEMTNWNNQLIGTGISTATGILSKFT